MNENKIAIIGAGPAGISTAIQLNRHGLRPQIFEAGEFGGLLRNAHLVENYPGFPGGISGPKLVAKFEEHLLKTSPNLFRKSVERLDFVDGGFIIETSKRTYPADFVVVASGTMPKLPEDIAIPENIRERVFTEIAPIAKIEGKTVGIVGAGDSAFDYALNLSRKNRAIILNRGEGHRCLQILYKRVMASPNIEYLTNTGVVSTAFGPTGKILLECSSFGNIFMLDLDFLIFAIGRLPRLEFVTESLDALSDGLLQSGRLYFVGDVHRGNQRQTAIAVGEGISAAMEIASIIQKGDR